MPLLLFDSILRDGSCVLAEVCRLESVHLFEDELVVDSLGALEIKVGHVVCLVVWLGLLVIFNLFLIF